MKDGFVISVWKKKQLGQNRSTPYLLYYFLVVFMYYIIKQYINQSLYRALYFLQ